MGNNGNGSIFEPPLSQEEFLEWRSRLMGAIALASGEAPGDIVLTPICPLLMASSTGNGSEAPWIKVEVPESAVRDLREEPEEQDVYFIGCVRRQFAERVVIETADAPVLTDADGKPVSGGKRMVLTARKERGGVHGAH